MTPSVEQIKKWANFEDADATGYVKIPLSAWDGLIWCLEQAEKIEAAHNTDSRGDDGREAEL